MSIMRHSNVQTPMNIYNEIQETKKKEAFEDLNDKIKISYVPKKGMVTITIPFLFNQNNPTFI